VGGRGIRVSGRTRRNKSLGACMRARVCVSSQLKRVLWSLSEAGDASRICLYSELVHRK
jgi:hypothetical protein